MSLRLKTQPQIANAIESRRMFHMKRGQKYAPRIPPLLHPKHIEREYERVLQNSFTKLFNRQKVALVSRLESLTAQAARELGAQRFDDVDDELTTILSGILVEFGRELSQNEVKRLAKDKGFEVSAFNKRQNDKVFKRVLEVDVFRSEPWLENALNQFASENASLISTLSERHVTEVRGIVTRGFRQGTRHEEIAKQIAARVGKTKSNVKLIARDQISKLNGQLTRLRQQDVGIKRYYWRTSQDERVRDTHRENGNQDEPFHWDNPPEKTGHPGEDFQCRCYAEPVLEDLFE